MEEQRFVDKLKSSAEEYYNNLSHDSEPIIKDIDSKMEKLASEGYRHIRLKFKRRLSILDKLFPARENNYIVLSRTPDDLRAVIGIYYHKQGFKIDYNWDDGDIMVISWR